MPEASDLAQFVAEVESDVAANALPDAGAPAEFREAAFTRMLAEELDSAGYLESPVVCHFERGRGLKSVKVSGYGVPEEDTRLDLFITIYEPTEPGHVATLTAADVDSAFGRLERFFQSALKGLHEELDPALSEYHMADRIRQVGAEIDRVNLLLLTNCRLSVKREKQRASKLKGVTTTYDVWDIERFRRLRRSGEAHEPLVVDLRGMQGGGLPCVELSLDGAGYRACAALVPGMLLRDLYAEHGSRLLELNVRSYLQAKGKINKGILETLRNAPRDFVAYNNGITVVAESVSFTGGDGRRVIEELRGLQIANGGQTTASIHRAAVEYGADLSCVFVQAKIVTADRSRFATLVPLISRYSNTQNKVSEPDLQANHPFHIGMERVSKREWSPDLVSQWFYERARGSYQTARSREGTTDAKRRDFDKRNPNSQRVEKEDLARYENCWRGLPYVANRGKQKSFTHFMTLLKEELGQLPDDWEPTPADFHRYMAKAILYREVNRIVKADPTITAYAVNVTNFTVSMLAHRTARRIDLDAIWRRQRLSPALADMAKAWAPLISAAFLDYSRQRQVHIDNTIKSQATWDHLARLDLRVPPTVEEELVADVAGATGAQLSTHHKGEKLSGQDLNNVKRCMDLTAEQWLAIVQWASGPGKLASWQKGIATTLASYASQGRTPSPKQAKHGSVMIDLAREAGVLG